STPAPPPVAESESRDATTRGGRRVSVLRGRPPGPRTLDDALVLRARTAEKAPEQRYEPASLRWLRRFEHESLRHLAAHSARRALGRAEFAFARAALINRGGRVGHCNDALPRCFSACDSGQQRFRQRGKGAVMGKTVRDAMTTEPSSVRRSTSSVEAARLM